MYKIFCLLAMMCMLQIASGQSTNLPLQKRGCASVDVLKEKLKDPEFKKRFTANQLSIFQTGEASLKSAATNGTFDTIPVVVHIILANPSLVTDAICQSQIDVLNEDFQGLNADSFRIPAAFKSLAGKGNLHFALAKTDPDGLPTSGIVRKTSGTNFSVGTHANAKYSTKGGLDGWDPDKYFNVWVVKFSDATLGIAVFPGEPVPLEEHGYMCDYRSWGRNTSYGFPEYNLGRTAVHEIGHFFNLYHIWGDDGGSCSGTDFYGTPQWDDTPNQADATHGNPDTAGIGKIVVDNCSKTAPGIMYQNFMDYSNDVALVMFTKGQWKRINQTLSSSPDRVNLISSNAHHPPPVVAFNAGIPAIKNNGTLLYGGNVSVCGPNDFTPSVKLINYGTTPLTSVNIYARINGSPVFITTFTGNLLQYDSVFIPVSNIVLPAATNTISFYTQLPNGQPDGFPDNDGSKPTQVIIDATPTGNLPISAGFEVVAGGFPPANWTIKNPDNGIGWTRATNAGKSGAASAFINIYAYNNSEGQTDLLVLPKVNTTVATTDSLILNFYYAYKQYANGYNDKLEVVVSSDCGNSWSTIWTKAGPSLSTSSGYTTSSFRPTSSSQWLAAKLVLSQYIGQDIIVAFRSTSDWGQNIYIDDVNLVAVPKTTMPVKLVRFTATASGPSKNIVSWTTASEINTEYFSVERSMNGNEFVALGKQNAKGASDAKTNYVFNDDNAAASVLHYRLNMVDKDGKSEYSNIITVVKQQAFTDATIFPNPVKDVVTVQFSSQPFEKAAIQITDLQGRIVYNNTTETKSIHSSISINTGSLLKGIYLLKLKVGDKTELFKLIKE